MQTEAAPPERGPVVPFLEVRGVTKRYDATLALRDVALAVLPGEVLALVGENGAGKSTLVKVLTGAVAADAGRILLDGTERTIADPLASQRLGIRVVHQHVSLVPELTVTENMLLGNLPSTLFGWNVRWGEAHRRARAVLEDIGFAGTDERRRAEELSLAQRKVVEIAKALVVRPRLLIMDEPSAALSHEERGRLFALIRQLKAEGIAVVYISHDLDEVLAIADRVTVLRDGAVVTTLPAAATDKQRIVELMVGRPLQDVHPRRRAAGGAEVLRLDGLAGGDRFEDVALRVAAGEIVGLYGLVGSGRTELARCIFGADRPSGGAMYLAGRRFRPRSPGAALRAGVAMLTEDRSRDGLVLFMSILDNVTLANFPLLSRFGVLLPRRQRRAVSAKIAEVRVRPPELDRAVRTLSGGNQQKVALAKWLLTHARLLVLDEPTWGVDVGAKQEIYDVIGRLAEEGVAILLISSDLPEVLGLADRVLVMRKGRLVAELPRAAATEQRLVAHATGVAEAA